MCQICLKFATFAEPDGQKVRILRMSNGEPFDENKWYTVAVNSYRANGGGELLTKGAGIPRDSLKSRIIWESPKDQRHYLMEEIKKAGVMNPQPNHNWKLFQRHGPFLLQHVTVNFFLANKQIRREVTKEQIA